eukprot:11954689-Prorocentrum_lima.AAC.1
MEALGTPPVKVKLKTEQTLTGPKRRAPRKVDKGKTKGKSSKPGDYSYGYHMVPSLEKGKPPQIQ